MSLSLKKELLISVTSLIQKNLILQFNFFCKGVKIFLSTDFISVTKIDEFDWDILKPLILTSIMDHYSSGKLVIDKDFFKEAKTTKDSEKDNEIVKQIKELIDQRVRPAVAMDGGDITFCSFENGIVTTNEGCCWLSFKHSDSKNGY